MAVERTMRRAGKVLSILAGGFLAGTLGIPGGISVLRAQTADHPAYVVAEVRVTDPAGFSEYLKQLPATLAPHHAKTLVRGLADAREGTAPDGNVVILTFDSLKAANDWYMSPAYQAIIPLRQKSATTRVYIVDGVAQ
jgi:uncharacterized protein (DUF1330 family)